MVVRRGFTLIELLVVIAIIAVLMGILLPALNRVQEHGRRAACLSNCKQMALAWNMYADDNDDKIVSGCTGLGGHNKDGDCWVYWPGAGATEERRIKGITDGLLYEYCPDIRLYKCPTGMRNEVVTYAIVDAMNGHDAIPGAEGQVVKNRMNIRGAAKRVVFIDEGRLSPSSWTINYHLEKWWDRPPVRHADGTNFSFVDGHSEYWKWSDRRTIDIGNPDVSTSPTQPGNPDLHRVQKAVWGKLGYTPTSP